MKETLVRINENIQIGDILLEKGDRIKILESYNWGEVVDIVNNETFSPGIRGLINFVNKKKDKYRSEISDFMGWWNDEVSDSDDPKAYVEYNAGRNKPSDTFDRLPTEDWNFYKKFANDYESVEDFFKDLRK